MSEFKTIPEAPLYEMDKEGYIQTIKKQSQIIPYPLGSKTVKLYVDDKNRKEFNVDVLIEEIFNTHHVKKPVLERVNDAVAIPSSGGAFTTKGVRGSMGPGNDPIGISQDEISEMILKLDTFTSVKIWKLYQVGVKNDKIMELVGPKNQGNVVQTIVNFTKSEKLREKADKVKL